MFGQIFPTRRRKTAVYLRVSTLTQVKDGYGLDLQEKMCRYVCDTKQLDIYKIYTDDGVSGMKKPLERDGMSELMKDAKTGLFEAVVFYSLDRIAREIIITFEIINFFTNNNIEFISCKENIDSSYQGKFTLSIYAAVNELELNTIKARLSMGREMKRKKDGDVGGRMPYGYKRVDKKIHIHEPLSYIIKIIYKNYYVDKISMNKIANTLNENNIETPRGGSKWYRSTVKSILNNKPKYEGCLVRDNENSICWPRILDCNY